MPKLAIKTLPMQDLSGDKDQDHNVEAEHSVENAVPSNHVVPVVSNGSEAEQFMQASDTKSVSLEAELAGNTNGTMEVETGQNSVVKQQGTPDLLSPEEAAVFDEIDDILNDAAGSEMSDTSFNTDRASVQEMDFSPSKMKSWLKDPVPSEVTTQPVQETGLPEESAAGTPVERTLPRTISSFRKMQQSVTPKRRSERFPLRQTPRAHGTDIDAQVSVADKSKL